MEGILEVGSGGQCPPGGRPTIRQPGFTLPRQQWSLLNRFRTSNGTAEPVERLGILQTLPLWTQTIPKRYPNDVPHHQILPSYQAEWWSVSASLC